MTSYNVNVDDNGRHDFLSGHYIANLTSGNTSIMMRPAPGTMQQAFRYVFVLINNNYCTIVADSTAITALCTLCLVTL